jgi:hypothetical protein
MDIRVPGHLYDRCLGIMQQKQSLCSIGTACPIISVANQFFCCVLSVPLYPQSFLAFRDRSGRLSLGASHENNIMESIVR